MSKHPFTMTLSLNPKNQILLYRSADGDVQVDVLFRDETIWINQKQMAVIFDTDRSTITKHINNIYE